MLVNSVAYRSSSLVLSRSDREKMAERGKSSASRVAMKLVMLLLMQITSLVALRSLGSSQTCHVIQKLPLRWT